MQLEFSHRLFGRSQQRRRQQTNRRHSGGGIDATHDGFAEFVDDVPDPGWLLLIFGHGVSPVGVCSIEHRLKWNWLANIDVNLAEVFPQRFD